MFSEVFKAWSTLPGITVACWYGGSVAKKYGWSMGKKAFLLHYLAARKSPKLRQYALSIAHKE